MVMSEAEVKSKVESKNEEKSVEEVSSPWYYFYSIGCGFCKKADPIIDELNKEGHNILKLDISDKDNQGLSQELKNKYNAQCGTPWFINAETGKGVCGFREKDVIEKWLNGEDIPAPPRPKGPMPKPPFMGAPKEEEKKWIEDYGKWSEENSHLPNLQTAEQILERPRPKTEPPQPPAMNASDRELEKWKKIYDKWAKENSHLPNLQPGDVIVNRMKARNNQNNMPQSPSVPLDINKRLDTIEKNVAKLMKHLGVK
jgi:thiol-disulfide isomerase/thioredoxin